jgi:hypothetical protein
MTKETIIEGLRHCMNLFMDRDCATCPIGFREGCALKLKKEALKALEQTRWVSVRERLPEQDKYVFVYLFGDSPYIAWHDGVDWCTDEFVLDEDEEPLEWMPLPIPKPYKEEENDKN